MDKVTIGTILKNRIKEMGFTQEEFADEVGIGLSTLRKYINGKNAYNYEVLELFADKLDCSFNYLLGRSKSAKDELHNAKELTRLSEEALEKISKYASAYDTDFNARRYIKCLDILICKDGAFNRICDFFIASRPVQDMNNTFLQTFNSLLCTNPNIKELGIENDNKLNLETIMMISIVAELKNLKMEMTPEFINEIKKLDIQTDFQNALQKMNLMLTQLLKHRA